MEIVSLTKDLHSYTTSDAYNSVLTQWGKWGSSGGEVCLKDVERIMHNEPPL